MVSRKVSAIPQESSVRIILCLGVFISKRKLFDTVVEVVANYEKDDKVFNELLHRIMHSKFYFITTIIEADVNIPYDDNNNNNNEY